MSKPNPEYSILLVDDEIASLSVLEFSLQMAGFNNLIPVSDSREVMKRLAENNVGIVVLDLMMPHISGEELLPMIHDQYPEIQIVVVTAMNDIQTVVSCMRNGACDFITKPVKRNWLISTVNRAIQHIDVILENERLRNILFTRDFSNKEEYKRIVTNHDSMHAIFRYVEVIAQTSYPVVITGETGVGKELIAEAIHSASGRTGSFMPVNIAGLDRHMFADTLFGHRRGAFTGADRDRSGLVAKTDKGTIFLDEIGDLETDSQIKLLRFLEEHKFYPIGSDSPVASDARVITATNRDLDELQKLDVFRNDLYYRLQTHRIHVPPLRERKEDIPLLVNHFVNTSAEKLNKKPPVVRRELLDLLNTYNFPGNIRELQSMVFDAVSSHRSGFLGNTIFEKRILGKKSQAKTLPSNDGSQVESHTASSKVTFHEELPSFKEVEGILLDEAMHRAQGNQTLAAKLLGISRTTLNSRLLKRARQESI